MSIEIKFSKEEKKFVKDIPQNTWFLNTYNKRLFYKNHLNKIIEFCNAAIIVWEISDFQNDDYVIEPNVKLSIIV